MTAPGDSVLIFILLALFVACCGYAAGRVHQRLQLKQDRDEAYRDGYETASNQVFSLAVRSVVPKRSSDEPEPAESDPGRAVRHQGVASADGPESVSRSHSANPAATGAVLGFPAPPPPPRNTVAEPPAVGGVSYQRFPDPRPGDSSEPAATAPGEPETRSGGKHTVPDELVRAATYRLPADRVFRAKVPNGTSLPEETTTNIPVPKPRRS